VIEAYHVHSFAKLRVQDGIQKEDLIASLSPAVNRSNVFKAGEASGASGSFFFSHDKHFIIKTMTTSEKKFFLTKFAKHYF
jgi:hypothetical protein